MTNFRSSEPRWGFLTLLGDLEKAPDVFNSLDPLPPKRLTDGGPSEPSTADVLTTASRPRRERERAQIVRED
jgi:hypothetical protein